MDGARTLRQLDLIAELVRLASEGRIECWLRGGWALDFLLGRVTRAHGDVDFFVWAADAAELVGLLAANGFEEVGGPPPEQQRNLRKDGEDFHGALLERTGAGVVTAGGRWADKPWPAGMLDGPIGGIGEVHCRVISSEAQLWAKEVVPRELGHAPRPYDAQDVALLRELVRC